MLALIRIKCGKNHVSTRKDIKGDNTWFEIIWKCLPLTMALPALCFLILLLLSFVPSFHAACPDRMYCPAGADCSTDTALCQRSRCPAGGNINLLSNWTDDCEEGTLTELLIL